MDYRIEKYATYGERLFKETCSRPSWAACHFGGLIDQKILLQFHNRKVQQWCDGYQGISDVEDLLGHEFKDEFKEVQKEYERIRKEWYFNKLSRSIPAGRDASEELQFLLFALVLLIKPKNILEFGVARGASSRALLCALEIIGGGRLVSIDFPFLIPNYTTEIGMLVPESMRKKWTLHIGPSQLLLKKILRTEAAFQLIVHDGAHSYYVQRSDLQRSLRALDSNGVLICDDVNNDSFLEVCQDKFSDLMCLRQPRKAEPIGLAWRRST